jgi:hypothetical protein
MLASWSNQTWIFCFLRKISLNSSLAEEMQQNLRLLVLMVNKRIG